MKKFFFVIAATFLSALATTNGAHAQTTANISMPESSKDVAKLDNIKSIDNSDAAINSTINAKAIKNFKKSYKIAGNEQWQQTNDGFNARFKSEGVDNIVYFTKKSNWAGSLKTYGEDKFDRGVRAIVKREYFDYNISFIQEIEIPQSNGVPTYIVHLEDDKSVKLIRITNGEMDVYLQYNKIK